MNYHTRTSWKRHSIQTAASASDPDYDMEFSEMYLKSEFKYDDYEKTAGRTTPDLATITAGNSTTSTSTATSIKIETETNIMGVESLHDTASSRVLVKGGQECQAAYNSLLFRMDKMLKYFPKQPRPCFYSKSVFLQCPACDRAYKGGRCGLSSLLDHVVVHHPQKRAKLIKDIKLKYDVRKNCCCFNCHVNKATDNPKKRVERFNNLSDYCKYVVLDNFQKLKGAYHSEEGGLERSN